MQHLLFTLAVTLISKLIYLHDRLRRRVDFNAEISGPGISRHSIPSGNNLLDAVFVEPLNTPTKHALLLCHGIGETVEYWTGVQRLLAEDGVASVVFSYSGYGRSTGHISARQCEKDALTAFAWMRSKVAPACPASLLGFSMGTGIAAAIAPKAAANRLVLCAGYTSFREAALVLGWPKRLAWMAPNIWDNRAALRKICIPVLIVHSERDQLFPVAMAQELTNACASPREEMIFPDLSHAAPIFRAGGPYWHAISGWLQREPTDQVH